MYLNGRLLVERIVSQAQALLPYDVWDVPDNCFACRRSITIISFRRKVTIEIAKGLRFPFGSVAKGVFVSIRILFSQTLRGVRRLDDASAKLLDRLIK